MNKNLGKTLSISFIVTLLFSFVTTTFIPSVFASQNKISVNPRSIIDQTLTPPKTFEVNVTFSITGMFSFQYRLAWNKTLLECTSRKVNIPPIWRRWSEEEENWIDDYMIVKNEFHSNETYQWHLTAVTALAPAPAFTGNWTFFEYTFKVKSIGSTPLDLYDTKISDINVKPIPHVAEDGFFTNVPPAELHIVPAHHLATNINQIFPINITISKVTSLYQYEFKMYYNTTLLTALDVELPPDHFLKPVNPSKVNITVNHINDNFNSTHGQVWFGVSLLAPETSKSGSGTLVTITFNATALGGPYPLTLAYPGYLYPVKLSDSDVKQIPCTAEKGIVTVGVSMPTQAIIYITPSTYAVSNSFPFTMNVNIANVTNLYSYEYKLFYNKTVVQAVSADLPSDHFLKPVDPTKILIQKEVNDNYNSTHGRIWFKASLLAPETAKSGNGSLTTITFKAIGRGSTFLRFEDTKLNTPTPVTPISHTTKDAQIISNLPVTPPIPSVGRMIDLFTQKEPYSGKGINKSSDAFAPQSEVILYANVTYRGDPVQNKLVVFEVFGPPNPYLNYTIPARTVASNESGIAMIKFSLPWPCEHAEESVFGTWFAIASVEIVGETVTDMLTFRVGWIVEIVSISTIDENLEPKTSFSKASCVGVKLHLRNIAMLPRTATIIVTAYDLSEFPFDTIVLTDFNVEAGETYIFAYCFLNISEQVAIGDAMVNASAYTANPSMGGMPYCPEVSARFVINPRDIAVIYVVTSSVDVIAGQIVNITVTVKNKGSEIETFPVSVYYGPFLVQSLFVESLSPNQNRTVSFVWNTAYVPAGIYTISGVAGTVRGETETEDNTYVDGTVTVRVPRIFMFPRELSIVALIVAAALALFAIILLLTRRKKKTPEPAMLTVDVIPS